MNVAAGDKSLYKTLMIQLGKINTTMRVYKIYNNITVEVLAPNQKAAQLIAYETITAAGFIVNVDD
ncbi:hypothetical protein CAL7716_102660 (plasmid) [Calothrix sp. PCC 7716]|nr:hypothetical protein CAL7716_102660 [Calothrix sp. PCC 7716]